jgi:hypothetical protein
MDKDAKCKKCQSPRLAEILAKCSDCCQIVYNGATYEGYPPEDFGIGDGGDDVEITLCLNCGQVQGKWPRPEPDISEEAGWGRPEDEDDEDEDDGDEDEEEEEKKMPKKGEWPE